MEKQSYSSLSLLNLLPDGKVESDIRITDKAVTGICTVYVKRSDKENEFLLREIGVAALDGTCNLTQAVQIAVEAAYTAAMSHISGTVLPAAALQPVQTPVPKKQTQSKPPQEVKPEPTQAEDLPFDADVDGDEEPLEPENEEPPEPDFPPSVDLSNILEPDNSPPLSDNDREEEPDENNGIERIGFAGTLFPASDLINSTDNNNNSALDDGGDPEYHNALDTEITIFGKLHECNNWKASKILAEKPDVIVDFCHRNSENYNGPKYTGPRTDQKEALFKLYPDAVRKVQKAA